MNLISQQATLQGFIVFNYIKRYPEAEKAITTWIQEGKMSKRFHIVEGLEKCPQHLSSLFKGANTGKM